ncbi:hypothetical protein NECAME_03225, partial [Necator americanus]
MQSTVTSTSESFLYGLRRSHFNTTISSSSAKEQNEPVNSCVLCSCGELSNRDNDDDTLRKISHPAISQSATSQTICGRRIDDKRSLAKKSLIQKYNLEHVYDEGEEQLEGRRRSISLDPEQWFEQVTEQGD